MIQSETVIKKVAVGESVNVNTTYSGDTKNSYTFDTLITMGSTNGVVNVTVNGVTFDLAGGFILNRFMITSVVVNSTSGTGAAVPGVILIGSKTRKEIFGN
jgi:hypothetical protein